MKNNINLLLGLAVLLISSDSGYASGFSMKSVAGLPVVDSQAIQKFYASHQDDFLWVDGDRLSSDTKDIIEDIGQSWEHGLNPANYRYMALKELSKNGIPDGREVETELLVTDAIIRYSQDISGMRLSPKELGEDTTSWSRGIDAYSLLTILSEKSNRDEFIQQLLPQDDTYKNIRRELKNLANDIAENPDSKTGRMKYPGVLKPGMRSVAIVQIRHKLGLDGTSDIYDDLLKEKVQSFQKHHGLAADGIIGQRSFDAINQTRTQKLIKLIANLERRRWVRRPMPSKYILVNIPQMQLQAIADSRVSFEMPVIIGRDQRPTTSFVDSIIGIRFNPLWYVPDTIKKEDFLPALRKDINALDKKGIQFRIKTETGMKKVSASEINWNEMNEEGLKSIQMYQDSGDDNALGLIRVLMPNKYDIYLHDTNAPALFSKDDRALSSGCVRVSEPRRIANFILGSNHGWSEDRIETYIKTQKLKEVSAEVPVPVYLLYYTAWQDAQDDIIITNDVYGWDTKLVQTLYQKGKIPFELQFGR